MSLTIQQLKANRAVHILPPVFSISRNWNLPVGPLTSQVDANTGDHSGLVLEAEGSEVQTVWQVWMCLCINVDVRYASWSRLGGGHNQFHMLRKDKEKKQEGADSFNSLYTLVSCSKIKTLQFNI